MNKTGAVGPLIAIVGPTATGKTDLALELAEKFDGEIVCGDSRTVYRGMDIGTAKPDKEQLLRISHHLLDVVQVGQTLSAADFKKLALAAIEDIASRGKLPFLVGGSGLWIDSVLYDYQFPEQADSGLRAELEALSDEQLLARLDGLDPEVASSIDRHNRRRVMRAIETAGQPRSRAKSLRPQTLVLGLTMNKETIHKRVKARVEKMLEEGFLDEVKQIGEQYGWDSEAMTAIGYRAFKDVVLGTKSIEQAKADFVAGDIQLAKKQMTWFKRNPDIIWLEADDPMLIETASRLVERTWGH